MNTIVLHLPARPAIDTYDIISTGTTSVGGVQSLQKVGVGSIVICVAIAINLHSISITWLAAVTVQGDWRVRSSVDCCSKFQKTDCVIKERASVSDSECNTTRSSSQSRLLAIVPKPWKEVDKRGVDNATVGVHVD